MCKEQYPVQYHIYMTFEDRESARVWIRNNQKGRRNLTPAWLIELELGNKEDLLKIGKAKKAAAGGDKKATLRKRFYHKMIKAIWQSLNQNIILKKK
jgi:hypothetical protein